ncbi:MAG: hypothetical protein U1A06_11165 [Hoeflea sp.]|nr:hypothetical protein [Hoeflea sp.]
MKRRNLLLGGGAIAALGLTAHSITRGRSYEAAAAEIWAPRARQSMGEFDFLVHHATLAANSHNTQPWMFSGGADSVTIHPDFTRATPAVDPDNHHLFASLGAAAENLSLAASAAGRTSDIAFLADQDVVRIDLGATGAATDPLFDAIVERQCTRSIYDGRQVPAEGLDLITQAAQVPGCSLMLITDKPLMEQVLELIVAANTAQIEDPAFVSELKHWLRFNAGQAVSHRGSIQPARAIRACRAGSPTWRSDSSSPRTPRTPNASTRCAPRLDLRCFSPTATTRRTGCRPGAATSVSR